MKQSSCVLASLVLFLVLFRGVINTSNPEVRKEPDPFRIGWISALSGPVSKYGSHQAAEIAVADINAAGGILGRPLELVMEDGRCEGPAAASAAQKLIQADRVKFILGGHCSTETLTVAPIAERNKVLVLASISSSPDITRAGEYIFRTSPVSTKQSELVSRYLTGRLSVRTLAVLYEDTAYVAPIAGELKRHFASSGGEVVYFERFDPGTTDFRTFIARLKGRTPDAVFLGAQAHDTAYMLLRQLTELGIGTPLFGNEVMGNAASVYPQEKKLFEGIIFGEAKFDEDSPASAEFIARYKKQFNVSALPFGIWTAETYDGVRLLAETINRCGDDVDKVRRCLLEVRKYQGVSGSLSIDESGDALREYVLKVVRDGKAVELIT